ncbi:NAD(P)H-dependent oxidoreductase [Nannocystis sp. ILAH1]|uniref:NAD(P)H-dependent oxidoreductase n=1 Tax=Nannocystis sp. ILAH1 TaxID=2996789 RepID=UPI00226F3305|nr:NAD(P)H-dependent oxidoreductase [Nannocystis sp. ILAH1]MCY0986425.1 NAD(P)H-dependent oxidoreductase [Nannocystis sp. ILAH1]
MKIFIVYAHPEPRSLNGSLRDRMVATLTAEGHEVIVSDLYAHGWKAALDGADFPAEAAGARLDVVAASHRAFAEGTQTADVAEEQRRLLWADAVILQFPLWWFSMPAILKGWVERVYAHGFAYGVGEHSDRRWGDRYGEGVFAGKRAMLVVTTGGWSEHYLERGINGPIDDLLFPIQHGILFYPGFSVLDPFVVYRASKMDAARFESVAGELDRRLAGLFVDAPIAYRQQNGGDYEIPSMRLKEGLEQAGQQGFRLHRS